MEIRLTTEGSKIKVSIRYAKDEWGTIAKRYEELGYVKRKRAYLGLSREITCYTSLRPMKRPSIMAYQVGVIDDVTRSAVFWDGTLVINVGMLRCVEDENNPMLTVETDLPSDVAVTKSMIDESLKVLMQYLKGIIERQVRYDVTAKIQLM